MSDTVDASTMTLNPDARPGPNGRSEDQPPPRRSRRGAGGRKKPKSSEVSAKPLSDEELQEVGRLSVLAAKEGLAVEDLVLDMRSLLNAYERLQAYTKASAGKG